MTTNRLLLLVIFLTIVAGFAFAPPLRIRLNNNSDWDLVLDVTDLTGAAGSDFAVDIESADPAQEIRVQGATGTWRIDVSRGGGTWHAGIQIYVHRTTDGTGGTTISGGTTYQEITTTDSSFFTGTGTPMQIGLQYKYNGAFAGQGVPSGTYTTTVTYTITDNT